MLSLLCTAVNEFIATLCGLRARYLKSALDGLLEDTKLREAFHTNGLIRGMQPPAGLIRRMVAGILRAVRRPLKRAAQTPAIKGQTSAATEQKSGSEEQKQEHEWSASYITGKTFASALLASLDPANESMSLSTLEQMAKDPDDHGVGGIIANVLHTELVAADGNMQKLRDGLARWFDDSMEQISGAYTRRMKWISLGVGLVIAVALNANSITIAQRLWTNPALQQQAVTLAETTVANPPPGVQHNAGNATPSSQAAPRSPQASSSASEVTPATEGQSGMNNADLAGQLNKMITDYGDIQATFPLGYGSFTRPKSAEEWLIVIFGLVFTGVALSFGAPFWFDLLSRFVRIRNESDPPPRSDEAANSS